MLRHDVDDYLHATEAVEGWLFPIDAHLVGVVDLVQKRLGISGHLFEIGVHHGKSALLLARAAVGDEILGVCDVFENQSDNVDRSGEGSRDLFLNNMRTLSGLPPHRLRIFSKRSEHLSADDTTRECRIVHVDGGHRPADVVSDLEIAVRALLPGGVVILDDVFNPSWPGVSEGFYRVMRSAPPPLEPFLIGGNKVFLAKPAATPVYREQLASIDDWNRVATTDAFVRETKEWLGVSVYVAGRTEWVDLDPIAAARKHLGRMTWRDRTRLLFGR